MASLPNQEHTNKELKKTILEEIENLKKKLVSEEELKSAKTRFKVTALRSMQSDQFFLAALLEAEVLMGSWEKAFDDLKAVDQITPQHIQELAKKYFTENNRVIGKIEKKEEVKK